MTIDDTADLICPICGVRYFWRTGTSPDGRMFARLDASHDMGRHPRLERTPKRPKTSEPKHTTTWRAYREDSDDAAE